jgi:outer membrane lipoprotein SlyB
MNTTCRLVAAAIAVTAFLGGCAAPVPAPPPQATAPIYPQPAPNYAQYFGVVESIQYVPATAAPTGIGAGAVIGGVAGAAVGSQIGGGRGNTAATVLGALGGAVVGNQVQQNSRVGTPESYNIAVRMDRGGTQMVAQDNPGDLRVGDRARIENGRVYRY